MVFRVVQHGRAHAILPFLAHEDLVVDTTLAAGPKGIVLGQLRIGHRFVTQLGIDLHDGKTRRQPEYLGVGI